MAKQMDSEFFRLGQQLKDTLKSIKKGAYQRVPEAELIWNAMTAEALRIIATRPNVAVADGPDCSLCDDAGWWDEEFGEFGPAIRCATCGPGNWNCPGEFCGSI